jgi:hypothetical protein
MQLAPDFVRIQLALNVGLDPVKAAPKATNPETGSADSGGEFFRANNDQRDNRDQDQLG